MVVQKGQLLRLAGVIGIAVALQVQAAEPEAIQFQVSKFSISGELPLSAEQLDKLLQPFVGVHSGLEGLQAAAEAIELELKRNGYDFFEVVVPPQTLQDGAVKLQVVQQRLGKVSVEGNKYFDAENVRTGFPALQEGALPNTLEISRSVGLVNGNPAKQVKVSFALGGEPGSINAAIKLDDQRTWNVFTNISNTGTEQTKEWRSTVGLQHNNLYNRDHSLTLAYTTAPEEAEAVSQFGMNYRWPLYQMASVASFYYSRSDVDPGLVEVEEIALPIDLKGAGEAFGVRLERPLLNVGRLRQTLSVALDNKFFEDDTEIGGSVDIGQPDRRSTPLVFGYDLGYREGRKSWSGLLQYAKNMELGSDNDAEAYRLNAQDTKQPDWDWWRYSLAQDLGFGSDWIWRLRLSGQSAGERLISGEQFGLGGASSVRGYEERVALGDNGQQLNTELWLPRFAGQQIRPLVFYDWGKVEQEDIDDPKLKEAELSGAGAGLRWNWRRQVAVSLDVAQALEDKNETEAGDVHAHFSLFARF